MVCRQPTTWLGGVAFLSFLGVFDSTRVSAEISRVVFAAKVGRPGSKQRIRLQNNELISEHLGKYGIHGIEDLVHEIYTCGPYFKQANAFLWTFKLSSPRKGFTCKRHGFCEPRGGEYSVPLVVLVFECLVVGRLEAAVVNAIFLGDWGNREELINELVKRMC